jgi:hypothetical protein
MLSNSARAIGRSREEERVPQSSVAAPGHRCGDVRIMDCVRFFQLGGASVTLLTVSRCEASPPRNSRDARPPVPSVWLTVAVLAAMR